MDRITEYLGWLWEQVKRGFAKLAASKVVSYAGFVIVALATVCLTNRGDIETAFPEWGARACAMVALSGALLTAFGQGIGSRRSGARDSGTAEHEALRPDGGKR